MKFGKKLSQPIKIFTSDFNHYGICRRCLHSVLPSMEQPRLLCGPYSQTHVQYVVRYMSTARKRNHYYDILGLSSKSSQKQIKTAYYALSKKYHPDVARDKASHVLFTEITEAYEVLGNIQKRRMYDKGMFSHRDQRVSSYEDEEDYTQAYESKAKHSPFERGNRPPPPTGRSSIYNFDEFYKQHYNDMRVRRSREKAEFETFKAQRDMFNAQRQQQKGNPVLMATVLMTFVFVAVWINDKTKDIDRLKKKDNKPDR